MTSLTGTVALSNLPPHRGLILKLALFAVPSAETAPPYNGEPPGEAITDAVDLVNDVHIETESAESVRNSTFSVDRPDGYYYLQVRAILFRTGAVRVAAQVEQFFFGPESIPPAPGVPLVLRVAWPNEPIESLNHYGTMQRQKKKPPWWRFW